MAAPGISPLAVVLNSSSGWDAKEDARTRLESILRGADVHVVKKGADISELVRELVDGGAAGVAAGGGDGTVRAAAEALAGSGAALGILPFGTLNHFARDLGLPLDAEAAAHVIRNGETASVDVGEVNGRVFVNNAILGLYPIYREARTKEERLGADGAFAVAGAALRVFRRHPSLLFRMRLDGREIVRRSPIVVVANNEHRMEGWKLGSRERLDSGLLWIYVLRERGRAGLLRALASVLAGRFRRQEHFEVFTARAAQVTTGREQIRVSLDGEIVALDAPLRFQSRARALRVFVHRGGAETQSGGAAIKVFGWPFPPLRRRFRLWIAGPD